MSNRNKFDKVTIQPWGNSFRLRYRKHGKDIRRVLDDGTTRKQAEKEAIAEAARLNGEVNQPVKRDDGLPIKEAMLDALAFCNANDDTEKKYRRAGKAFEAFIRSGFPMVTTWGEIRPSMLQAWAKSMQEKKLAFDTIRLALVPVRRAAAYWAAEYPDRYRDFAKAARIQIERPQKEKEIPVLSLKQLRGLLEALKRHAAAVYPIAVLQSTCGLRMMEAAHLRRSDVDLCAGTVRICDTGSHKPKNLASYRTIPICDTAKAALQGFLQSQKVRDVSDGPLFTNSEGKPWACEAISRRWHIALKGYPEYRTAKKKNVTGPKFCGIRSLMELPADFIPRELRATFATILQEARALDSAVQAYLGHTAKTVLGKNYQATKIEYLRREVADVFEKQFREIEGKEMAL